MESRSTSFHTASLCHLHSSVSIHLTAFNFSTPNFSIDCLVSSSQRISAKTSTSNQTLKTVSNCHVNTLKAANFETLALKNSVEINFTPSTRKAFFKKMLNIFLLSSTKYLSSNTFVYISWVQKNDLCETTSSNVFVINNTSFEPGSFYLLHALHEALDEINKNLRDFGFSQKLEENDSQKHPVQTVHKHPMYYKP